MDTEASRVVVALIGDTSDLDGKVVASTRIFERGMSSIEQSAAEAEGEVRRSYASIGEATQSNSASQLILQSVIRRTSDQLAAGAPIATIFAEHISGLTEAAELAGGSFGKFGAVLAGPWGLALSAGVSILSILVQKHFEASDATEGHASAAKHLVDAFEELNRVTGQSVRLHDEEALAQAQAAARTYEHTRAIRDQTRAQLEQALAAEHVALNNTGRAGIGSETAGIYAASSLSRVNDLKDQLAQNNADVAKDAKAYLEGFRGLRADQILTQVKNETDATAAATDRYQHSIRKLRDELAAGTISEKEFHDRSLDAQHALDAAKDSTDRHTRSLKGHSDAAREAAAAERDLETSLANLEKRYDPIASAADAYLDALKDIANLEAAHKIDADTAALYRQQAAYENIADTQAGLLRQQKERHDDIFGGNDGNLGPTRYDTKPAEKLIGEEIDKGPFGTKDYAQRQKNIESLAAIYQRAFEGGSGSIWKTFERQGLQTLALLLARFTVLQATQGQGGFGNVLSNLKSAASSTDGGGGAAGAATGIASLISSFFGRASGGYVGPNSIHRVNEQGGGVELLRMGPQGGTVIPLGSTRAASGARGGDRTYNISVSADHSVTPEGFASDLAQRILQQADAMDSNRQGQTLGATPGVVRRTQTLRG